MEDDGNESIDANDMEDIDNDNGRKQNINTSTIKLFKLEKANKYSDVNYIAHM